MRQFSYFFSFLILCIGAVSIVAAQNSEKSTVKGCDFNIIGTWKSVAEDGAATGFYRYTVDGRVTVFSEPAKNAEPKEIASAAYKLDNPVAPKTIEFTATDGGGIFQQGKTLIDITTVDDITFKSTVAGSRTMRWVKVDPNRYFVVLAARSGPRREGGPAFAILIKADNRETKIDSVGLYFDHGRRTIGPIPQELYREFMTESPADSDVMLRLEVTPAEFERALKVAQTWQRRARNHELLYQGSPDSLNLNNTVLLKELVESLNRCSERIKLYTLDWSSNDEIAVKFRPPHIPFQYFKKLRQFNELLHVKDSRFHESIGSR